MCTHIFDIQIQNCTTVVWLHTDSVADSISFRRGQSSSFQLCSYAGDCTALRWDKGISISNTAFNLVLPFPRKVSVPYWQVGRLSKLLCGHHYALIQILTGFELSDMEVVVLFSLSDEKRQQQQLYPVFK